MSASIFSAARIANLLNRQDDAIDSKDLQRLLEGHLEILKEVYPMLSYFGEAVVHLEYPNSLELPEGKRILASRRALLQGVSNGFRLDLDPFWVGRGAGSSSHNTWFWRASGIWKRSSLSASDRQRVPLISVIIPCYNYGKYLLDAVESILNQTLSGVELIVVDGGSNDAHTREVLEQLSEEGVQVFIRSERSLVGSNRNFGIERSNAPFVCCLDADDVLDEHYLEKTLFRLLWDNADVAGTGARCLGASNQLMGVKPVLENREILSHNGIMSASVFRKELWEKVGGYEDFGLGDAYIYEDWHFWCKCALAGARFLNLPREFLIGYRVHSSSSLSRQQGRVRSHDEQSGVIQQSLQHRSFDYVQCPDVLGSEESLATWVARQVRSSHAPGSVSPLVVLIEQWKPEMIERIRKILKPYRRCGHELIWVQTGNGMQSDSLEIHGLHAHEQFWELSRFLEDLDQKLGFLCYLIESRSIPLVWSVDSSFKCALVKECEARDWNTVVVDSPIEDASDIEVAKQTVETKEERYRLQLMGSRHPESEGNEVWILDLLTHEMNSLLARSLEVLLPSGWKMVESEGSPRGFALVGTGATPLDICLPHGTAIRFLEHRFSGQVTISNLETGENLMLDLYAGQPDIRNVRLSQNDGNR
ncbi:MAG: glycosyltransferase family A protein [Puniceicoccaceae bacterium]